MKLSQSPEAMEIKRALREGLLRSLKPVDATEHNRQARKLLAEDAWRQRQSQLPAERLQRAIDSVWEKTVAAKQEREAQAAARSFHRGPGDPDWMA
jgi:hypothetical protein